MLRPARSASSETPRVNSPESWTGRLNTAVKVLVSFALVGLAMNLTLSLGLPPLVRSALYLALALAFTVALVTVLEKHVHGVVSDAQARRVTEHLKAANLIPGVEQTPALLDAGEDPWSELEALHASAPKPRHSEGS